MIKLIEDDGWYQARTRVDHRQYTHPEKRGLVTMSGHPTDEVHPRTSQSVLTQAQLRR